MKMPPSCPSASEDEIRSSGDDSLDAWFVPLPRVATLEQWQAGRAGRRKLCERFNGIVALRRKQGTSDKDVILRRINHGERGGRFATMAELERSSVHAMEVSR